MKKMTTIKVSRDTKSRLDRLKRPGESYDEIVARIASEDQLDEELSEAYISQERYHKELLDEWDKIQDGDW